MEDRTIEIRVSTLKELCKWSASEEIIERLIEDDVSEELLEFTVKNWEFLETENILEFLNLACSKDISRTLENIKELFNKDIDVVMEKSEETLIPP